MLLRRGRAGLLLIALLSAALMLAACSSDDDDDTTTDDSTVATADEATDETADEATDEAADDDEADDEADEGPLFGGKTVEEFYAGNCLACHGKERQGVVGPELTPTSLVESADFYFETIAAGRAGTVMPSWRDAGMSDASITAMVEWLQTVAP